METGANKVQMERGCLWMNYSKFMTEWSSKQGRPSSELAYRVITKGGNKKLSIIDDS